MFSHGFRHTWVMQFHRNHKKTCVFSMVLGTFEWCNFKEGTKTCVFSMVWGVPYGRNEKKHVFLDCFHYHCWISSQNVKKTPVFWGLWLNIMKNTCFSQDFSRFWPNLEACLRWKTWSWKVDLEASWVWACVKLALKCVKIALKTILGKVWALNCVKLR